MEITVIKRDGTEEDFDIDKVSNSIMSAALEVGGEDYELADTLAEKLHDSLVESDIYEIKSEDIETMIQDLLVDEGHSKTAAKYIIFANDRARQRELNTSIMKAYEDITFVDPEDSDVKRENANIDSNTAMGVMLKYGSEGAKLFNGTYLLDPKIYKAHKNGDIHIHDFDFYTLTETCCQIPLDKLFKGGFNTGHGFLREPGGIRTAGALAAIAIQSNQNDQHKRVA